MMNSLFELQQHQYQSGPCSPQLEEHIVSLRAGIPKDVLEQFDRLVTKGRKPVAIVHNGVCGECHLKIPVGVLHSLAFGGELQRCGNCGRYLFLPEDEPLIPKSVRPTRSSADKKSTRTHVI